MKTTESSTNTRILKFLCEISVINGSMDDLSQKQILQYTLVEKLGEGHTGPVYQAWDTTMERIVALRIIPAELLAHTKFRAQCLVTLRALSNVSHPNIGNIYGASRDGDRLIVVMEYISGETVKQQIRNGPISNDDFLALAIQIARGLTFAHEHHIIHGNIRPSNIIITEEGTAKLVDFGLSTHMIEPSEASPFMFDEIRFRAPAHIVNGELTPLSDLYSLGEVYWELLTGKPTFTGPTQAEVEDAILHKSLDFDTLYTEYNIPGDTVLLLEKLLGRKKDDRFLSAREMLVTLEAMQAFERESKTRAFFQVTPSTPRQYLMLSILTALLIIFWLVITTVHHK